MPKTYGTRYISEDSTPAQNSAALQKMINGLKDYKAHTIILPDFDIPFTVTPISTNKVIYWEGQGATRLISTTGAGGMRILRTNGYVKRGRMTNIEFFANVSAVNTRLGIPKTGPGMPPKVIPLEARSAKPTATEKINAMLWLKWATLANKLAAAGKKTPRKKLAAPGKLTWIGLNDGLFINTLMDLEGVNVIHFGGNGITFSAAAVADGTNCNGSTVTGCKVEQIRGDGFYMEGPDANQIIFNNCITDHVGGIGWHDRSFLGCVNNNGMAHVSGKWHYHIGPDWDQVDGAVTSGRLNGCYGEEGSLPSRIRGWASNSGNGHFNGLLLKDNASSVGPFDGWFRTKDINLKEGRMSFGSHTLRPVDGEFHYEMVFQNGDGSQTIEWYGPTSVMKHHGMQNRTLNTSGVAFHKMLVGNNLEITGAGPDDPRVHEQFGHIDFIPGDKIKNNFTKVPANAKVTDQIPSHWICLKPGRLVGTVAKSKTRKRTIHPQAVWKPYY